MPYRRISARGLTFLFKWDDEHSEYLHIWVRHATTIENALDTYFNGATTYDPDHRRFITSTGSHTLYWFWREPNLTVVVITCFRREGG